MTGLPPSLRRFARRRGTRGSWTSVCSSAHPVKLIGGLLVVAEPQGSYHAAGDAIHANPGR